MKKERTEQMERHKRIDDKIKSINQLTLELSDNHFLFFELPPPPIKIESLETAELGFIKMVTWLYVLYVEISNNKINHKFWQKYIYKKPLGEGIDNYEHIVHDLRTYFQHKLEGYQKETRIRTTCTTFFNQILSHPYPKKEEWQKPFNDLLDRSELHLQNIYATLQNLLGEKNTDEMFVEDKLKLWKQQHQRPQLTTHDFREVFYDICQNLGLSFDPKVFCHKNRYDSFIQNIRTLDIQTEVRAYLIGELLKDDKYFKTVHTTDLDIKNRYPHLAPSKINDYLIRAYRFFISNEKVYLSKEDIFIYLDNLDKNNA